MKEVKTLSQALRRIKELRGKIAVIDGRLQASVLWEEDKVPDYKFDALLEARGNYVGELLNLKGRLAVANANTKIEYGGGMTVQSAVFTIAEKKTLVTQLRHLNIVSGKTRRSTGEYDNRGVPVREEVTICSAITSLARDELVSKFEAEISEINDQIEAVNHRTNL